MPIIKRAVTLVSLLLLSGCQFLHPSVKWFSSFELSPNCPSVCWLGITPDKTDRSTALSILSKDRDIKNIMNPSDENNVMTAEWESKGTFLPIWIYFKANEIVDYIKVQGPTLSRVSDFVKFLGPPDKTSMYVLTTYEDSFLVYALYYSATKTYIECISSHTDGPNPDDYVKTTYLNVTLGEFASDFYFTKPSFQSWRGYGHLNDYLPGIMIPTSFH